MTNSQISVFLCSCPQPMFLIHWHQFLWQKNLQACAEFWTTQETAKRWFWSSTPTSLECSHAGVLSSENNFINFVLSSWIQSGPLAQEGHSSSRICSTCHGHCVEVKQKRFCLQWRGKCHLLLFAPVVSCIYLVSSLVVVHNSFMQTLQNEIIRVERLEMGEFGPLRNEGASMLLCVPY